MQRPPELSRGTGKGGRLFEQTFSTPMQALYWRDKRRCEPRASGLTGGRQETEDTRRENSDQPKRSRIWEQGPWPDSCAGGACRDACDRQWHSHPTAAMPPSYSCSWSTPTPFPNLSEQWLLGVPSTKSLGSAKVTTHRDRNPYQRRLVYNVLLASKWTLKGAKFACFD